MDELRVTGIVIGSIDYKEKDKLITIYSLQLGKISATLRGVKNPNAKLKFASQLFCFAEFILTRKGEYFTVISAEQIESFYNITSDFDRFLVGQGIFEMVNILMQPGIINESFFVFVLKCLNLLAYDEIHENIVLTKFMLHLFALNGYQINFNTCGECGSLFNSDIYFDFQNGFMTCKSCVSHYGVIISKQNYAFLKLINNADIDVLPSVKINGAELISNISVLTKNFNERFGRNIKTLKDYLLN